MIKYLEKNIDYIIYILILILIIAMIIKKNNNYNENFFIKKKVKSKNNKIKYILDSCNCFKKKCNITQVSSYAQVTNNYPLDYYKYISKYPCNYINNVFKSNEKNDNNEVKNINNTNSKIKNFGNILNIDPKKCNRVNFWNSNVN